MPGGTTLLRSGMIVTRHPRMGAVEIPCGNSAGTLAESAPCSARPHKHWRLHVYVRQHEWNQAAKGKMAGSRLPRGNLGLLRRQRDESKGPELEWASRARSRAVASAAVAVKGLRFAPMNAPENGAPLTAVLAAAALQL